LLARIHVLERELKDAWALPQEKLAQLKAENQALKQQLEKV